MQVDTSVKKDYANDWTLFNKILISPGKLFVRSFATPCIEHSENMYVAEKTIYVLPYVVLLEYDETIKLVDIIEIYIDNNLRYIKSIISFFILLAF